MAAETVSKLGVLCRTLLQAARRFVEADVVALKCSVHNGSPNLEHEVCSSRRTSAFVVWPSSADAAAYGPRSRLGPLRLAPPNAVRRHN